MTPRTFVAFVADFPTARGGDDSPAGRELAGFVATQLGNFGIDVRGPNEREGWAWDITASLNGTSIATIVGLVDDMDSTPPRQWLITNDFEPSFWNRLLGSSKKRMQREIELRRYCETLHAALSADPRFSQIYWYNKMTFDKPGDKPSAPP